MQKIYFCQASLSICFGQCIKFKVVSEQSYVNLPIFFNLHKKFYMNLRLMFLCKTKRLAANSPVIKRNRTEQGHRNQSRLSGLCSNQYQNQSLSAGNPDDPRKTDTNDEAFQSPGGDRNLETESKSIMKHCLQIHLET